MWFLRFLSQILATLIALPIFFIAVFFLFAAIGASSVEPMPGSVVLKLDMRQALPDKAPGNPLANDGTIATNSVVGVVRGLQAAERDGRVKGIYLRVGGGLPIAQAQELREALKAFKDAGKFVIAHTQSIQSTGLGGYYLGAAADEFWMQPNGDIYASGMGTSTLFFKRLMDEYGVEAEAKGYKDYKTALHAYRHEDYTEPMREARMALLTSIYNRTLSDIAADRDLSFDALKTALDAAPNVGQETVDKGLIDNLGYEVDVRDAAKNKAGPNAKMLGLRDYLGRAEPQSSKKAAVVALIQGDGAILEGSSAGQTPFGGDATIGGDTIAKAIMDAAEADDVKAILFRVNSPGGSAIASEQIRYAVTKAQEAGKPVIVSMGNVAASGGYWVSMSADHIVAHPGTITGSIGVIFGKFVVKDLYERFKLHQGELSVGEGALLFSSQRKFSPEEWERVDRSIKAIYDEFVARAAEGREMSAEELEQYAQGRVWSGSDALERKLIDSHGGIRTALNVTRDLAKIDAGTPVVMRQYPAAPTVQDLINELFSASVEVAETGATVSKIMGRSAVRELMNTSDVIEQDGPVAYEETGPIR